MSGPVIIFLVTLLFYAPMAFTLLYVWHKFGQGERAVTLAKMSYLLGSGVLFLGMILL